MCCSVPTSFSTGSPVWRFLGRESLCQGQTGYTSPLNWGQRETEILPGCAGLHEEPWPASAEQLLQVVLSLQGNKKGPLGRWDFDTQEEYSEYMNNKEALPK